GPKGHTLGIALDDVNALDGDTEDTRRNLGEAGGVALTRALRATEHCRIAIGVHDDAGAFVPRSPEPDRIHAYGGSDAGAFRERPKPYPEIAPLRAQVRLQPPQLGVAREFQRHVHGCRVVAGIDGEPGRQLVWHGGRRHEIHPPHITGIASELPCEIVDHALDEECRFGMASAAVRTGRHPVRVDTNHFRLDVRDVVRARHRNAGVDRGHTGSHPERVRTDVCEEARAKPDDPPVATSRELDILDLIATMRRCEKTLAPTLEPGARTAGAD